MNLLRIIYVSSAVHLLETSELEAILESSVRHNEQQEVTGMLLYAEGAFIQVLEGPEEMVDETYSRISEDNRHRGLILIQREQIEHRDFNLWNMGFKVLNHSDIVNHPGYANFFENGFNANVFGIYDGLAYDLLKDFQSRSRV